MIGGVLNEWNRSLFSDYFGVNIDDIDEYGAINISLINDLPLFIDPFCYLIAKRRISRNP